VRRTVAGIIEGLELGKVGCCPFGTDRNAGVLGAESIAAIFNPLSIVGG
jgi:hypothetical protein